MNKDEVLNVDKDIIASWMEAGMIQVPSILLSKYKQIGLSEKELVLLLHIQFFIEEGNEFPTPEQLSERMAATSRECSEMLGKLLQLRLIAIEDGMSEDQIRYEKYSLKPLWIRLAEELSADKKQKHVKSVLQDEQDLYTVFEQEFGRPLSPMECENLAMWLDEDQQDPAIIKAALREAVISGKLNFRYIDRILFNWKKNGVKTIEQARLHGMQFRQRSKHGSKTISNEPSDTVPFYNWLEQ
jgi:DNA replication protein